MVYPGLLTYYVQNTESKKTERDKTEKLSTNTKKKNQKNAHESLKGR